MSETIVLDPAEETTDRVEVVLHGGAFMLRDSGPDWGDAVVEPVSAEAEYGEVPVDHTVPNRQVGLPLMIGDGGPTFAEARRLLQHKTALTQREGALLKRSLSDGSAVYLDVVGASLALSGSSEQAQRDFELDALLSLETLPDWYGAEQQLGAASSDASGAIRLVLDDVPGDFPARLRIAVTNNSGTDLRGLLFAARPYDPAPTAAMDFAAVDLTPLGPATRVRTLYVEYTSLPPAWVGVLSTDIAGVGPMTHVGTYRIFALTERDTGGRGMQLAWEYTPGSALAAERRPIVTVADGTSWNDLGQVVLPRATAGAQTWRGRLLANAPAGSMLRVRRVLALPVDDAFGRVGATTAQPSAANVVAWDDFNSHAIGALDGKTAPLGGPWAGTDGGGGTDAMQVSGGWASRIGARQSLLRFTYLSAINQAAVDLSSTITISDPPNAPTTQAGAYLLARYINADSWLIAGLQQLQSNYHFLIQVNVAGTTTVIADSLLSFGYMGGFHGYRLTVDTSGLATLYVDGVKLLQGSHPSLATGGALAAGAVGLADSNSAANNIARIFGELFVGATTTVADAVLFARTQAELSTKHGYQRAGADGTSYGAQTVIGDHPRLPVSGAERRQIELYMRYSKAALGQPVALDDGADSISARAYARPCYLFTPDAA